MKAIDLSKALKPYTKGWVAINQKTNKAVAHANSYALISKKIEGKKDILLVPASKNYFGFVIAINA